MLAVQKRLIILLLSWCRVKNYFVIRLFHQIFTIQDNFEEQLILRKLQLQFHQVLVYLNTKVFVNFFGAVLMLSKVFLKKTFKTFERFLNFLGSQSDLVVSNFDSRSIGRGFEYCLIQNTRWKWCHNHARIHFCVSFENKKIQVAEWGSPTKKYF